MIASSQPVRVLSCWLFAAIVLVCFPFRSSSAAVHEAVTPKKSRRELIVKFRSDGQAADKARALKHASGVQNLGAPLQRQDGRQQHGSTAVITVEEKINLESELARLQLNPAVEYVEPNFKLKLFDTGLPKYPDDFEFAEMYALYNTGKGEGAKTNADIHAPQAWNFSTGDQKLIVAVVDTGIDYFHEDLKSNLWVNTKEIPFNGIDDDGNGFVDDYHGYDFVSHDSDPFDDNEHGTHVAGTIGAKGNNGIGTVGVCWNISLMPLKAFDQDGNGNVSDAISAIHYAVDNGARIINASWGTDEKSRALEEATHYAADAGVLIIAAAGNNRNDVPAYPASFPTVLAVGATDNKDTRAIFSNFGSYVSVAAPGVDILSTLPENRYGLLSGTSMAAPHVSGVAALVLSRFPNYSRQELIDILINSVDPVPFDQPLGNGRIDANRAIQVDEPLPLAKLTVPSTLSSRVDVVGSASGTSFSGYTVLFGAGKNPTNWLAIASSKERATNKLVATIDSALVPDGPAVVQLVVSNQHGATAVINSPVTVLNGLISSPLAGDVLTPGAYPVSGTVYGPAKSYQLFVGAGLAPTQWTPITPKTAGPVINEQLGEWDAREVPSGYYTLRLVVSSPAGDAEFNASGIYIDHQLGAGWPVHLKTDQDFPTTDWRNLRVADLDGDGRTELILVDPATRSREQELLVYSLDGQLLWSRKLGFDIPPDVPAIGDIDGDGKMEIFVDGTNGIVAFHHDGTPLTNGWPVETSTSNHAKVLADLDGDGRLELISFSQEYAATQVEELRELAVYSSEGKLIRKWDLPWCGFTNDVQKIFPAVANLDDEPGLEIVAVSGCSEIAAFDYRRPEPKWRSVAEGTFLSSPVIGDVDGDGSPDVVVAAAAESGASTGGIYIFKANGQRWRGWPVLEDYSFTTSPALADLDNDGRLEMILPSTAPTALHVLQWDGFEADNWPQDVFEKATPRIGASIADVNGDGVSDIVLPASGYLWLGLSMNDTSYLGGITAWDLAGNRISLNGNNALPQVPFEAFTTRRWHKSSPVVLLDMDGNGLLDMALASIQERTFGSVTRIKDRSSIYHWELRGTKSPKPVEWPMFAHDARNSGAYSLPLVPISTPTNVTKAIRDRIIALEDRELRIEPLLNDWNAGESPLNLVQFTQPQHGRVRQDGQDALIYLPSTNFSGTDEFSYTIRDSRGTTSNAKIILRVKPVDDPPVAEAIELTMKKNSSVGVYYTGKDPENETLSFRIIDPPAHGELWNYPAVGDYHPARGYFGVDSFSYVANDGHQDSAPARVTINIINSNNPPVAISQNILTKTNRSVLITPDGTDPDNDPLTYELVTKPATGSVTNEPSGFRYSPAPGFVGEISFSFRAFDGSAYSDPALITVGVIATNASPRASNSSIAVQPNSVNPIRLSGSDPDGDKLSYTIDTLPLHGTVSGTPPSVTYVPATNYIGPDRFTFHVSDGFAQSTNGTVTIQVSRQNRPPKSDDQTIYTSAGLPVRVLLKGSDPDQDPVDSVILKGPARGLLYGRGTNLTYAPKPGAVGSDSFSYKLWDGQKFGNAALVTVQIAPPLDEQLPSFVSIEMNATSVEVLLSVPNTRPFNIESSTNLYDWLDVTGSISSNDGSYTLVDTNRPAGARFYRAVRK